jgi:multicomponent Na+:H+ antiporter subunit D
VLSSLLAVAYVWRFVETAYFRTPPAGATRRREAPASLLVPAWLMIAASIYFGLDTSVTVGSAAGAAETLMGGSK